MPLADRQYKAFSGANIFAHIGHRRVGTLQAMTVSITREVAALYSFSDANPKAFVKGKRGIAGTLVFTQFDREPLLMDVFEGYFNSTLRNTANMVGSRFAGNLEADAPLAGNLYKTRNFGDAGTLTSTMPTWQQGNTVASDIQKELKSVYDMVANQRLRYPDQIQMFDITLTMVDDAGNAAFCVVGGIQIVNAGFGYSIDDLVSDVAYTYVARSVTPLTPIGPNSGSNQVWDSSQFDNRL